MYSGQKILLVDDDPSLRDLYNATFRLNQINLSLASTGVEGVQKAKAEKPTLILLDLMLPDLSGFGVLKMIKADPKLASTKIWMLTNLAEDADKEQAKALGADEYLVKANITPKQLADKIKSSL